MTNEDFEWHGHRKDFDYKKIKSNVIKEFMAKKNLKKFKMPRTTATKSKELEANP